MTSPERPNDPTAVGALEDGSPWRVRRSQLLRAVSQICDLSEAKPLGHGQRVALIALRLLEGGDAASVDRSSRTDIVVAGLLHDVGISSVAYNLYERVRERERSLLSRYPAVSDGLFGLPPGALDEEDTVRFVLSRHAGIGAGMIGPLKYSARVVSLIGKHHSPEPPIDLAHGCLALADLLETATGEVATIDARRAVALEVLDALREQGRLPASLLDRARVLLGEDNLWTELASNERVTSALDACLELTTSLDDLDAHMRLLAQIVDAQSPYMAGHTLEVTRLARRIGEHIGLEPEALEDLYFAGLIHGSGRLGISSAILEKSGGLSDDEFDTLYTYPDLTRHALAPLISLRPLIDAASTHREKLDGSGYPEGRVGADIPLVGRIFSVADTFIALVSDRPYRSGYSRSRALQIIQSESARLFDGLVTDALEAVCREGL